MGRYKLFYDFLWMTDRFCTNYIDVLTEAKYLGIDDDKLLVPTLFYLGSTHRQLGLDGVSLREVPQGDATDDPISRARNAIQMIELTLSMKKLQGHSYNIYEYCFLSISESGIDIVLLCVAAFYLISQISLLIILIYHNWGNITNLASWRGDCSTIIVVVITTLIFASLAYAQCRDAFDFNTVFRKAVESKMLLRMLLLGINIFVNGGLGVVIVVFNFFFLITSKDVNDAIVNSLALLFIIEMDDVLKPEWGDVKFDSRFLQNIYYCITKDDGDVQVKIIPFSDSEGCSASAKDYMFLLERSDDKAHFILREDGDKLVVVLYFSSRTDTKKIVEFHITGANGRIFFEAIKGFNCVQSDKLANVDVDDLMEDIKARAKYHRGLERVVDHEIERLRDDERYRLERQLEDERDRLMTEKTSFINLSRFFPAEIVEINDDATAVDDTDEVQKCPDMLEAV